MLLNRKRRRRGVTLVEVLVAMFVMALGMVALLTLFPLGAMQIGQALRDDRTGQVATQADKFMRDYWRNRINVSNNNTTLTDATATATMSAGRVTAINVSVAGSGYSIASPPNVFITGGGGSGATAVATVSPVYVSPTQVIGSILSVAMTSQGSGYTSTPNVSFGYRDPNLDAMDNPIYPPSSNALVAGASPVFWPPAGSVTTNEPSYPVLIDILGSQPRVGTNDRFWTAFGSFFPLTPVPNYYFPRRDLALSISAPNSNSSRLQTSSLLDDWTFDTNGAPIATVTSATSSILERQGKYNWAAVLQRPLASTKSVATLKILMFDGRVPFVAGSPGLGTSDEVMVQGSVAIGSRSISVTLPLPGPSQSPLVRRGGWLMDGTIDPVTTPTNPIRNANFYRITGVTEGATTVVGGVTLVNYSLDLDQPIKQTTAPVPAMAGTYTAQLYFFNGLIEVFERKTLQANVHPWLGE
ncbi:type IV pilus modification PilV family protein [Fimbriiglobus ruber]|uniref:Uncharacterized protein n=1 Tax=Fimbriiglobus ruber TaxID=1908690 RepID=A0A225DQ74_9BACT|nr:prepilin-type N-terminal cleavage/methylation domain-containing protein [Fimbriiglobus ruber]OWK43610.1 hypothetical protein FRUB_03209 [Fimbriiglobus ruber]